MANWKAYVDGASRGNPGVAGIGVLLINAEGEVVREIGEPLGITTNNVAEYSAMVRALEEARALGCDRLEVYTDSQLMAFQINGQYAVKKPHLVPYFLRVKNLLAQFESAQVQHIRRELNKQADALSNIGADKATKRG
jgi:ribonuclease HI